MPESKPTKYRYLHVLQGHYGTRWEDLTTYECEDVADALQDLKSYRENEPAYLHRMIMRRELRNPVRTESYKIVRFVDNGTPGGRTIKRGLTLEQAQAHCSLESTHGVNSRGQRWFDGYEEE